MVPPGGVPPGNGQVAPQGGNGVGVVRADLGTENVPPHPVAGIVFVAHDQVGIFVAEQLAVPFAGRGDIIRHGQRRHAELDEVLRQRGSASVSVVFPVGYQDQRRLHHIDGVRCPHLLVEGLAVLEHPDHVGNVPGQILVKKNQPGFVRPVLKISLSAHPGGNQYGQNQNQGPYRGAFHSE